MYQNIKKAKCFSSFCELHNIYIYIIIIIIIIIIPILYTHIYKTRS